MKGQWLLVLGANSDMAVATARHFARNGWNIALASRDRDSLVREAANLRLRYGVEVRDYFFDARDFASHPGFYASLAEKPDAILLAFGLLGDQQKAQGDFSKAQALIETNLTGAVSILEIVAADFEVRRCGLIIGISSVAGDRGRKSNYLYGCAKAGFTAYLSGLRHRLAASGVHVLTVKPGFVATKMTTGLDLPQRLLASPDDVAAGIARGARKRSNTIYVKPVWRVIMWIVVHLPEQIFKKTNL